MRGNLKNKIILLLLTFLVINPFEKTRGLFFPYEGGYQITNGVLHGIDANYRGVDIKQGCGSPTYAPHDGIITYAGLDGYNYKGYPQATLITIESQNYISHLIHLDVVVTKGEKVKAGQLVGFEASHGSSTGCHLHWSLYINNQIVNPLKQFDTITP